jgi:hypothetical protein
MDDKVANEIIDFITAKNTNGPLLYHQKISTGKASVTEILLEKRTNYLRLKK